RREPRAPRAARRQARVPRRRPAASPRGQGEGARPRSAHQGRDDRDAGHHTSLAPPADRGEAHLPAPGSRRPPRAHGGDPRDHPADGQDNSGWGYLRIQGELKKLDHSVARTTIAKTLKDAGLPPSPDRPTSWRTFLQSHAKTIAATDFFTAEVWTPRGLVTH